MNATGQLACYQNRTGLLVTDIDSNIRFHHVILRVKIEWVGTILTRKYEA